MKIKVEKINSSSKVVQVVGRDELQRKVTVTVAGGNVEKFNAQNIKTGDWVQCQPGGVVAKTSAPKTKF